jgi:hypothetical protein
VSDSDRTIDPPPRPRPREDDTSPFPLERGKGEETGPFLLERGKRDSDRAPAPHANEAAGDRPSEPSPHVTPSTETPLDAPPELDALAHDPGVDRARAPLSPQAVSARRRIVVSLVLHGLVLLTLAGISIGRFQKGLATPPELALAVFSGGVALVHLRASFRFARLGREPTRDGHLLAAGLANLRSVIVLKAVVLFLTLTLLCFSLSMIISLVASI